MRKANTGLLPKSGSPVESGDPEQCPEGHTSSGLVEAGDWHEAHLSEAASGLMVCGVWRKSGPFPLLHGPSQMPSPGPRGAPFRAGCQQEDSAGQGGPHPSFGICVGPLGRPGVRAAALTFVPGVCSLLFLRGFRWDGGHVTPLRLASPGPQPSSLCREGWRDSLITGPWRTGAQCLLSFVWDVTSYFILMDLIF